MPFGLPLPANAKFPLPRPKINDHHRDLVTMVDPNLRRTLELAFLQQGLNLMYQSQVPNSKQRYYQLFVRIDIG